jgi:glycosyltransferase 2 family protein
MDFAKVGDSIRNAKLWPMVAAAVLNFICLFGKAIAWRLMLGPRHRLSVLRLFRYTIATFAASAIAPARVGEVLRLWVLKRRDNVPVADSAAVAVAEKLLDGMTILLVVSPVPWLVPGLPTSIGAWIAVGAAVAIGLFIGLYIAAGRVSDQPTAEQSKSMMRQFLTGMQLLRNPLRLSGSLVVLISIWLTDLVMVFAVFEAVGLHLSVGAALLTLLTLNVAIAIPSTPAQVGVLELGAMTGLALAGADPSKSAMFALLYHVIQVVPVIAAGLIFEWRLVLGRDHDLEDPPAGESAEEAPVPPPQPTRPRSTTHAGT